VLEETAKEITGRGLNPHWKNEENATIVDSHKMHIFTANIPTFHSRYRR
jgi:hypothetical protein